MTSFALEVTDLQAWYGESQVLHGVSFNVAQGEIVTLLGHAGAGRSTTLRALLGLTGKRAGSVRIDGAESIHLPADDIPPLGVGYSPEERGIFGELTCEENLLLPPSNKDTLGGALSLAEIYELLPGLQERRHAPGTRLTRGEQRLLAVARLLRTGASVLLLDEISESLAPAMVQAQIQMLTALRGKGYTVLMADHNFSFAASVSNRFYVMRQGRVVDQFGADETPAKAGNF